MIELRGLTWAHTRGFAPLAALGRVWEDFHPDVRVTWTTRSLFAFGEEPLAPHLDAFDLFVFDYPFAGEALHDNWVLDLTMVLDAAMLAQRRSGTVGPAYDSFLVDGALAAVPIDVATHVAASRPDLLDGPLPRSLSETIALARRTQKVAMPLRPTGVWGAFLSLCANAGDTPFRATHAFNTAIAAEALAGLADLARHVPAWCAESYPVALLNRMASTDEIAYVPFTYGYCPYAMAGYAPHRLAFDPIATGAGHGRGAILGGAGIGISARSRHVAEAARHLAWLTSPEVQAGLYVGFAGQPAQRAAWQGEAANTLTQNFFRATLDSAEHPYVRPNRPGFHAFQNFAAPRLHRAVIDGGGIAEALRDVEAAWTRA